MIRTLLPRRPHLRKPLGFGTLGLLALAGLALQKTPFAAALLAATESPTMRTLSDDDFWNRRKSVSDRFDRQFADQKPFLGILAPSRFDPSRRTTLPCALAQAGTVRDYSQGSLLSEGRIVVMDLDRNTIQIGRVHVSRGEEPPREPNEAVDLDDPGFGMAASEIDLLEQFPDLAETVGRYHLMAFLPRSQTATLPLTIGPANARAFETALAKSLASAAPAPALASAWLTAAKPWEPALLESAELPEGIQLKITNQGGRTLAWVTTSLAAMAGERLTSAGRATLPADSTIPDALRNLYLIASYDNGIGTATQTVPATEGAPQGHLRSSVTFDLDKLFPPRAGEPLKTLRVFCGGAMAGPTPVPAP